MVERIEGPERDDLLEDLFPRSEWEIKRPSAFGVFRLPPEPVCGCGHTKLEHRIDKTCGQVPCLCIRFEEAASAV